MLARSCHEALSQIASTGLVVVKVELELGNPGERQASSHRTHAEADDSDCLRHDEQFTSSESVVVVKMLEKIGDVMCRKLL